MLEKLMSKGLALSIIMLAAAIATFALNMNTAVVKQAFATGGSCSSCASSFTPKSQSSSLSGSGEPVQKEHLHPDKKHKLPVEEVLLTFRQAMKNRK